jgi:transketolase
MATIQELERIASQVRRDIIRQTHFAASGHPGGSLGCTDFLTALYFEIMEHDPKFNMEAKNEDVFFLFRYAMTGNPVGAPIGEISEVIGKE